MEQLPTEGWIDYHNVKYKQVYLKGYSTMAELTLGLTDYFVFYNNERPHQSLAIKRPRSFIQPAQGVVR